MSVVPLDNTAPDNDHAAPEKRFLRRLPGGKYLLINDFGKVESFRHQEFILPSEHPRPPKARNYKGILFLKGDTYLLLG